MSKLNVLKPYSMLNKDELISTEGGSVPWGIMPDILKLGKWVTSWLK